MTRPGDSRWLRGGRLHVFVGLSLLTAAVGVGWWTLAEVRRDHSEVVSWFAEERQRQLAAAATKVEEDFQDVGDDLDFAARLMAQGPGPEERRRSLSALLGTVDAYRVAVVYDGACERALTVTDPRWTSDPGESAVLQSVDLTSARTCGAAPHRVETSTPIADSPWFRAFATPIPDGSGVVAIVVDTRPILDRLKAVSADASAELIVLGPHGLPTPATSLGVAGLLSGTDIEGTPMFSAALSAMRAGESGSPILPGAEAAKLGFPAADLVVVYLPIRVEDGNHWSVAALVSTQALQTHEQAVLTRFVAGAVGAVALLGILGGYVIVVARREAGTSERLRAADQIAHLRDRAERIVDHIPSMVLALGPTGTVTAGNAPMIKACPSFLAGVPLALAFPRASGEALSVLGATVAEALRSGRTSSTVARRVTLLGDEGVFTIHAIPISPPSADIELLLVIDDVTAQRRMQDQLLHVEKLATVGVLAAGLAHEVGTPLGVIRGRAEYVAAKLGADHPQVASLAIIVSQIDRVVRIVRGILDFSGSRTLSRTPIDVGDLARGVGDLVRFEAERRNVEVLVEMPSGLPQIAANLDQVQQVIVNLTMNAMDAAAPGGHVWIRAEQERTVGRLRPRVRLDILDDGRGIPEPELLRIFDPFYTTKKRGQGTGLGLAIVSQIVRDHGGEIAVHSTEGRGTTVQVFWPMEESAHA